MVSANFIFGGNSTFQVINPRGDAYMFSIKKHKEKDIFFVRVNKDAEYKFNDHYAGYYDPSKTSELLKGSKGIQHDEKVMKVFLWAVKQITQEKELPEGYEIKHVGKCGCCGRKLTDELSKELGIGPTCLKRVGTDDRQKTILALRALGL